MRTLLILTALLISACNSGGGSNGTPPEPDPVPQLKAGLYFPTCEPTRPDDCPDFPFIYADGLVWEAIKQCPECMWEGGQGSVYAPTLNQATGERRTANVEGSVTTYAFGESYTVDLNGRLDLSDLLRLMFNVGEWNSDKYGRYEQQDAINILGRAWCQRGGYHQSCGEFDTSNRLATEYKSSFTDVHVNGELSNNVYNVSVTINIRGDVVYEGSGVASFYFDITQNVDRLLVITTGNTGLVWLRYDSTR